MKTIKIRCSGTASLPIEELKTFQGRLKRLSNSNFIKLKKMITEFGFIAPLEGF